MSKGHPNAIRPSRLRRLGRGLCVAGVIVFGLIGFGFTGSDYAALLGFAEAADRWQTNPEFRTVAMEYSIHGSEAMRSRPFGITAAKMIMGIRSAPGLPKAYAVNPTSQLHYQNFSRGPLSAYLHLSGEQDIPSHIAALEPLGRKTVRTDADLKAWLDERQMDFPIVRDRGAYQSLDSLLADTDAGRPFAIRDDVPKRLMPHIAGVARDLGVPEEPERMTAAQQQAVYDRLDGYVHRHDPELWRTKQVNDFLAGIWAQVYGPVYRSVLMPFLVAHVACRVMLVLLLAWLIARFLYKGRRAAKAAATAAGAAAAGEPAAGSPATPPTVDGPSNAPSLAPSPLYSGERAG